MTSSPLQRIQQLQFSDRKAAEALLLDFVRHDLGLAAAGVELRPLAVSLNSFNGFLTMDDGRRLFFKTHTESDTVINEYYQASVLAEAGYPIIQPVYRSTEVGRQFLVYELIEHPSVFDLAWEIECGTQPVPAALAQAQHQADDQLFSIYQHTLQMQTAEEAERASVHQLFYHRLTGGRLDRFYGTGTSILLPDGEFPLAEVRRAHWRINGQVYDETLDDLIGRATILLQPGAGASIIGHGDAHNGNIFYVDAAAPSLLYFDPAFAGRHSPLLDLAKPLFHNVFAMWMYHPAEKAAAVPISLERTPEFWQVDYDDALAPIRQMFLASKATRVLKPTLRLLQERGLLPTNWREQLKAALFCCPFLTMNLADRLKFPPPISLLGLAMSVEMGAESQGKRSVIDLVLDEAAPNG